MVTAAEMLSVAAFVDGRQAQAFPSFGSERMGAPVVAYCRIDDEPIRSHEPVSFPDAVVIGDPTLLHQVDLFAGLGPGGSVLINTSRTVEELGIAEVTDRIRPGVLATVPATDIALRQVGRPYPNTALLGALARLTGAVSANAVAVSIRRRFAGSQAEMNVAAACEAAATIGMREGANGA